MKSISKESLVHILFDMDNQLKKYALQLTQNYPDAIELINKSKEKIINDYDAEKNVDVKWLIYKTIKDVHLSSCNNINNSILMDSNNDCYLVLQDNTIKTLNNPFKHKEDCDSPRHLKIIQDLFIRSLIINEPKYVVIWNDILYENFSYNGFDGAYVVLPDASLVQTKLFVLPSGHKVSILPVKHHKVGLPKAFWFKAILDFVK